jgi:UDPglucose 6-dehydrogenase
MPQTSNRKIAIIGVGMVGGALAKVLSQPFLYDKYKKVGSVKQLNQAEVIFICVPTPFDGKKGFDLSCVQDAFKLIKGNKIVVIKSTVLPGTTEMLQKKYRRHKVLFNPEFLTQESSDQDMKYPDRQIIGYTKKSYNVTKDILQILPLAPFERIIPATEAETAKYFGNCWFSAKVVYANQMYDLCQKLDIDYNRIKECVAADKRIGPSHLEIFHKGYRGYSGKCLPKDMQALIQLGNKLGVDLKLLKTTEKINKNLNRERNK